jgi:DNA invertase Pin-like site-specific DNA recombinase
MSESTKIESHHLQRIAYLYIRQSTLKQVFENSESTKRQYALRSRAIALGWPADRVVTIDSDLGESGASALHREGFRLLVSEVGLGNAGIVMGIEVSRLARNNADWHQLLEICAITRTLILDEEGVYDPYNFNDRLLLGLKGTMSEAELHIINARLRGGALNKANRGEFRSILPTGFIYNDVQDVVLDPDIQVRESISFLFKTFARVGSAHQVAKIFKKNGLLFPSNLHSRFSKTLSLQKHTGIKTVFLPLTPSAVVRTLSNPRYAGAYTYGRRQCSKTIDGKRIIKPKEISDWLVLIPDAHPGYITLDQFYENRKILEANKNTTCFLRNSPPREGNALLQGLVICGMCGRHMHVKYAWKEKNPFQYYTCNHGTLKNNKSYCQLVAGKLVDAVISELIIKEIDSNSIEITQYVCSELKIRQDEVENLFSRAVERAKIDSDLAQRRFMNVDPNNRLVADTLETDWNDKLKVLAKTQEDLYNARKNNDCLIDALGNEKIAKMIANFRYLWSAQSTPNRERKRLLAQIVENISLFKNTELKTITIGIIFKAGRTEWLTISSRTSGKRSATDPHVVELIDKLLDKHTYSEIAQILNNQGFYPKSPAVQFSGKIVAHISQTYKLRSRYDRLLDLGMLTKEKALINFKISVTTLHKWVCAGIITRHACDDRCFLYEVPLDGIPGKYSRRDAPTNKTTEYK